MRLRKWLEREGLSFREAAPKFDVSYQRLMALCRDDANPTCATMDHVKRVTDGKVTRIDWPEREAP